jgi:hypothetical protein
MAPDWATSSQHDDRLPQHQDLGFQRRARAEQPRHSTMIGCPQHQDLGFQRRARSEQIDDNPKNYSAEIPQKIIRFCVSRQLDGIYDRDRIRSRGLHHLNNDSRIVGADRHAGFAGARGISNFPLGKITAGAYLRQQGHPIPPTTSPDTARVSLAC